MYLHKLYFHFFSCDIEGLRAAYNALLAKRLASEENIKFVCLDDHVYNITG